MARKFVFLFLVLATVACYSCNHTTTQRTQFWEWGKAIFTYEDTLQRVKFESSTIITKIAAGISVSFAIDSAKNLYFWGNDVLQPMRIATGVELITIVDGNAFVYLLENNTIVESSMDRTRQFVLCQAVGNATQLVPSRVSSVMFVDSIGDVYYCGTVYQSSLGVVASPEPNRVVRVLRQVKEACTGGTFSMFLFHNETVAGFGKSNFFELQHVNRVFWDLIFIPAWRQVKSIQCGERFTAAIEETNFNSQSILGTISRQESPDSQVTSYMYSSPSQIFKEYSFTLFAGYNSIFITSAYGALYGFGDNLCMINA